MILFTNTKSKGSYPVGFVALAVADDAEQAAVLLNDKLKTQGLNKSATPQDMEPFEIKGEPRAVILFNGDY